ncbi:MAG: NADH dehydrogenase FAD-containing subunit [Deltaproteobacteria bacterium]|nr:NADH dehydrogenase FAD-containing subunit [Deltaproteobacteria bacterium]
MIWALISLPILAGVVAFFLRPAGPRRALLLLTALGHSGLTALAWVRRPAPAWEGWLLIDPLGLLFLSITSVLFLVVSIYALGYFHREDWGRREDFQEGFLFSNAREPTFTCCLLLFLGMMTLVTLSQHFGLLWVAVEATTLASAPLIYFHRHYRSLEATWKYIMICSVGIALALLGNFFLAVASTLGGEEHVPMLLSSLIGRAPSLHTQWLKAAFLFLLVGYGTKMGLAPLHTWLPDAHSESPSVISALLPGALLNCAFLAIPRVQQVTVAAGLGEFGRSLMLVFGLFSMVVAAAFIIRQLDFKRMLAYSSIEHMGILSLAVGLGANAGYGAVLHAVNHSLTKGMLFLVAGNILAVYRSKSTTDIRGISRILPISGALWVAGFFAITGSPPFGAFLSELVILKSALDQGRTVVAVIYLLALGIIFIGMATIMLRMVQGDPAGLPADHRDSVVTEGHRSNFSWLFGESALAVIPPMALGAAVLILGLYIPPALRQILEQAARAFGGV